MNSWPLNAKTDVRSPICNKLNMCECLQYEDFLQHFILKCPRWKEEKKVFQPDWW